MWDWPLRSLLGEDRNSTIGIEGFGGWALEIISDKAVPLITCFRGELFLEFHLTGSAHHPGKRVEDHGALEGHGSDGIFLEMLDFFFASEAFLKPVGVVLASLKLLRAGIEIDTAEMEGFEFFTGFL